MGKAPADWEGTADAWTRARVLPIGFDYAVPLLVAARAFRLLYNHGGQAELLSGLGASMARAVLEGADEVMLLKSQWERVGALLRAEATKLKAPTPLPP